MEEITPTNPLPFFGCLGCTRINSQPLTLTSLTVRGIRVFTVMTQKIFSEVLSLAEFKAAQGVAKLEFEISQTKKHQSGKPVVFFLNGEGGFLAESLHDEQGKFKAPSSGAEIVVGKSEAGWVVYSRDQREIVFTL